MRDPLSFFSTLFVTCLASAGFLPSAGCASPDGDSLSGASSADTASDLAEAKDVLALLGGENGHCGDCHGVTAQKVRAWGTAMTTIENSCFAAEGLSAVDRINCLRSTPTTPASPFAAKRLGLYAAGAAGDQFKKMFDDAFGADSAAQFSAFTQKAAMPRSPGKPLTADEFAKIKAWVLRGMPQLDEAAAPPPRPTTCTPSTTPELAAHITAMKTSGWGARLADQGTPMFGCDGATSALACMTSLPDATSTWGAQNVAQTMRQLRKAGLASHYWVRSSADGRYVGYGMNDSAKIVDLTRPDSAGISIEADYDPYFLPSNDGFAFAGSHEDGSIRLCRQSLLADVASATAPQIALTESKCSAVGDDVYMSIGTSLDGARYLMTFGSHENDDGGNEITSPLPAAFSSSARTTFTPMVNNGLAYQPQQQVAVTLPYEGDMMLSPSGLLSATRFGDGSAQLGYRIHFIKTQPTATGVSVRAPQAAEFCMAGQKPNFSFDERFVASHQYVDHSQPDQAQLPEGSSNIVVADLVTGKQVRITTSKEGQFALYPHFRADGWLYFVVRDMNDKVEYVVASDVTLRIAANP